MEYVTIANQITQSLNTFKHNIKRLFFGKLQKESERKMTTYLSITRLKDAAALGFCLSYIITCCVKSNFFLCSSPKDNNGNKVFLDLYFAIPVFLGVLVVTFL